MATDLWQIYRSFSSPITWNSTIRHFFYSFLKEKHLVVIIFISTLFFLKTPARTHTPTVGHICVQICPRGRLLISQPIKRGSLEISAKMSNPFSCLRREPYGRWRHRGQCIFNPVFQKQVLAALPHKGPLMAPNVRRHSRSGQFHLPFLFCILNQSALKGMNFPFGISFILLTTALGLM